MLLAEGIASAKALSRDCLLFEAQAASLTVNIEGRRKAGVGT